MDVPAVLEQHLAAARLGDGVDDLDLHLLLRDASQFGAGLAEAGAPCLPRRIAAGADRLAAGDLPAQLVAIGGADDDDLVNAGSVEAVGVPRSVG
ncbi:hypothetical protein [Sphingomonas bacterium]|uniref:hypothetical protein n=1 Tax=Sphingomonas bacterium TaxID=1895847 RepID=UPI0015761F44|nr:hypothetical protein [Sphingomonas bacterium]